nr:MAG TPA: hypothetical protein [Caudoviricetes sp.]
MTKITCFSTYTDNIPHFCIMYKNDIGNLWKIITQMKQIYLENKR